MPAACDCRTAWWRKRIRCRIWSTRSCVPKQVTVETAPTLAAAPSSVLASTSVASPSPAIRPDIEEQIRKAETLSEILRLRGRGEPGRSHIQIYEEDDQLRTITFGELYERASVVAADLRRRGLEPAQTVAIMLPTCAEFFWTFAGILLAGGIPVPIYPPFRADRIAEYATRQSNIL